MPCPGCSQTDNDRTDLLMCGLCRHARTSGYHYCSVDGADIAKAMCNGEPIPYRKCPLERHTDKDGYVRWMGARWMGVPFPLRVWFYRPFRTILRLPPLTRPMPGCGCHVRLKLAMLALENIMGEAKKDRFWWLTFAVVALILGFAVAMWLSGCTSSTRIEGGKSEAKAVTEEVRPKTTTTTTITITLPKEQK